MPNSYRHDRLTTLTTVYDADLDPTAKAIDILEPGTLEVVDIEGKTAVYTFTGFDHGATSGEAAVTSFPYRLYLEVKQVVGDGAGDPSTGTSGTTIAKESVILLH